MLHGIHKISKIKNNIKKYNFIVEKKNMIKYDLGLSPLPDRLSARLAAHGFWRCPRAAYSILETLQRLLMSSLSKTEVIRQLFLNPSLAGQVFSALFKGRVGQFPSVISNRISEDTVQSSSRFLGVPLLGLSW